MKLYKLLEILQQLKTWNVNFHGMIYATSGGEIALTFTGQPEHHVHDYLIDKGFVDVEGDYVYRPKPKIKQHKWTHSICFRCWGEKHPGLEPTAVTVRTKDVCCFCGGETTDGIYVRHDLKSKELRCQD